MIVCEEDRGRRCIRNHSARMICECIYYREAVLFFVMPAVAGDARRHNDLAIMKVQIFSAVEQDNLHERQRFHTEVEDVDRPSVSQAVHL